MTCRAPKVPFNRGILSIQDRLESIEEHDGVPNHDTSAPGALPEAPHNAGCCQQCKPRRSVLPQDRLQDKACGRFERFQVRLQGG